MTDEPTSDATVDVFQRGRFVLVQPARGGHRAGMDALVLAATVPSGFGGAVADFGAGAGAVGLAIAARCERAQVHLVERSPEMAAFARLSLQRPENARIAPRVTVVEADIAAAAQARAAQGLAQRSVDFVVTNPPFNDPRDRATRDEMRRLAHVSSTGFDGWLRSAAATLRPRGRVALIARPESLSPILAALEGRFGGAEIVPLHAAPFRPAIRVVIRATLGSRARLSLRPALHLAGRDEPEDAAARALLDGEATLFGD